MRKKIKGEKIRERQGLYEVGVEVERFERRARSCTCGAVEAIVSKQRREPNKQAKRGREKGQAGGEKGTGTEAKKEERTREEARERV